ncbi:hypothetical protein PAAG_11705 [Paracoccidioides lutzii Pb01]|uniref:Uncharacterized protein n=1 Tax=Paracoccidioides lutzii (strain ATCC MYA-826 / Pb01) TaxID=502779 RepID=A0A0A2V5F3_PARBA|nr:hypothetical protein PAAG_11705 [Paracoccidioides lutzii Pb01]KGQ01577.1 hypothetical protein PAAG_11705 [Paracoccidioides lutzii Pb01]
MEPFLTPLHTLQISNYAVRRHRWSLIARLKVVVNCAESVNYCLIPRFKSPASPVPRAAILTSPRLRAALTTVQIAYICAACPARAKQVVKHSVHRDSIHCASGEALGGPLSSFKTPLVSSCSSATVVNGHFQDFGHNALPLPAFTASIPEPTCFSVIPYPIYLPKWAWPQGSATQYAGSNPRYGPQLQISCGTPAIIIHPYGYSILTGASRLPIALRAT